MEAQAPKTGPFSDDAVRHWNLLVEHIKMAYRETEKRLQSLVSKGEITYDLLWALFKQGEEVYTLHPGTDTPMAFIFDHGAERKGPDMPYFIMDGYCFDYHGKGFGQARTSVCINRFLGVLPIHKLKAFPLRYHPTKEDMKSRLRENGKKFVDMMYGKHCEYEGVAYCESEKQNIYRLRVGGKIEVDPYWFRQMNPNYPKLLEADWLKWCSEKKTSDLLEDDYLVFAPTLFGFSLKEKFWGKIFTSIEKYTANPVLGEFAIDNISEIKWSEAPFNQLVIPKMQKEVMLAVVNRYLTAATEEKKICPGDYIPKKGEGRIILCS